MKPRCLYSLTSPSRMKPHAIAGEANPTAYAIRGCREYAKLKFEEAQESENYVCVMQPLDADDPMYGVIITQNGLSCHQPMEFDYYQAKVAKLWRLGSILTCERIVRPHPVQRDSSTSA